jgi:hypothetical protein
MDRGSVSNFLQQLPASYSKQQLESEKIPRRPNGRKKAFGSYMRMYRTKHSAELLPKNYSSPS